MKKHASTVIFVLIFIVGLCLLLYPTVSDWWNSRHQSKAIASYTEAVENLDTGKIDELLSTAKEFNTYLAKKGGYQFLSEADTEKYYSLLNITDTGIMAYVEIPSISVYLPIYHGTSDAVLQVATGHLEWTSLPIGGESTHCVISGHRGLPSAKLFTNLDKITEGDVFMIHILNETLTYQVDKILIVEPEDTSALSIVDGKDLFTLVTCTPYGINTHRLLVRGHRIENLEDEQIIIVSPDANQVEPLIVAPLVAAPILAGMLIYVLIKYRKKKG